MLMTDEAESFFTRDELRVDCATEDTKHLKCPEEK